MDLSGQNILVTGGAGGIGIGICRRLHLMGANIAVHYFRSEAKAKEQCLSSIFVYWTATGEGSKRLDVIANYSST